MIPRPALVLAGLLALAAPLAAQDPPPVPELPAADDLDAALPFDPQVIRGTLPNGLRYYIMENRYPEQRAELRLGVKVGSVVEDDDQRGLAHVAEHMAFNGTTSFPKNDLVHYLQSIPDRRGDACVARSRADRRGDACAARQGPRRSPAPRPAQSGGSPIVIPRLQELDPIIEHQVHQAIDRGDASRPDVGAEVLEVFRFPDPARGVAERRFHEGEDAERRLAVGLDPVAQVVQALVLQDR